MLDRSTMGKYPQDVRTAARPLVIHLEELQKARIERLRKLEPRTAECPASGCRSHYTELIDDGDWGEAWRCRACGQGFHGVRRDNGTFQLEGVYRSGGAANR